MTWYVELLLCNVDRQRLHKIYYGMCSVIWLHQHSIVLKASKNILKNIRINSCACVGIKNICFEGSRIMIKERERE